VFSKVLLIAVSLMPVVAFADRPVVVGTSQVPEHLLLQAADLVVERATRETKCAKFEELWPNPAPPGLVPPDVDSDGRLRPHVVPVHYEVWTAFGCNDQHSVFIEWSELVGGWLLFSPDRLKVPPNYRLERP
jgi:hypothetical protein